MYCVEGYSTEPYTSNYTAYCLHYQWIRPPFHYKTGRIAEYFSIFSSLHSTHAAIEFKLHSRTCLGKCHDMGLKTLNHLNAIVLTVLLTMNMRLPNRLQINVPWIPNHHRNFPNQLIYSTDLVLEDNYIHCSFQLTFVLKKSIIHAESSDEQIESDDE